jgi:hypothetical protein
MNQPLEYLNTTTLPQAGATCLGLARGRKRR